jgi:membrane protein DedA with SNARE-associated domain
VTTTAQLIWSIVTAAIGVAAASGLALLLIPQLSLRATIRGGTIAFLSMAGVRLALWWSMRRKQHRG